MAEEARVRVRAVRRDALENLKKAQKDGGITEDDFGRYEKDVQKLTDDSVKKIDDAVSSKEAEIMKV